MLSGLQKLVLVVVGGVTFTSLIPLALYFKGPHVKVDLAIARGKRQYDKRESIKRREIDRELKQRMKHHNR